MGVGCCLLGSLWFARSVSQVLGLAVWIVVGSVAVGPGAAFTAIALWREARLSESYHYDENQKHCDICRNEIQGVIALSFSSFASAFVWKFLLPRELSKESRRALIRFLDGPRSPGETSNFHVPPGPTVTACLLSDQIT